MDKHHIMPGTRWEFWALYAVFLAMSLIFAGMMTGPTEWLVRLLSGGDPEDVLLAPFTVLRQFLLGVLHLMWGSVMALFCLTFLSGLVSMFHDKR